MPAVARKAVVLAAGLGTRLRPLTAVTPKPLMPVWGVPMLERAIETLRAWGVDDIVVNAHYLPAAVEAWADGYRSRRGDGLSLRVVREPEILGTGGVLNPLRAWIGDDDFYLVNGDVVFDTSFRFPARRDACEGVSFLGDCLLTASGPRTVERESLSGAVTCWRSLDPGWPGTYTYCGVARLSPRILAYVAPEGFSSIVDAYEKAAADGWFVRGCEPDDLVWADAGTVDSYLELNGDETENAYEAIPQIAAAAAACAPSEGALRHVSLMGNRGSDRAFFRLSFARRDAVAVVYDDARRPENARYAGHARWLAANGIPVPAVRADLPGEKTLVLDYSGPADLLARLTASRAAAIDSYRPVVETLARFNALVSRPDLPALEPAFDAALWTWEHDLFETECLKGRFGRACPPAVRDELARAAERLSREPVALVHRDFQSSNVIWKNDRFEIIDFQGMRRGPAIYDLASLLYDPYAELAARERTALAALYAREAGRGALDGILPVAAVQRLCQALGAYGRLAAAGQTRFSRYVMPALRLLLEAADEAGFDAVGALAEDLIAQEGRAEGKEPPS